MNAHRSLLLGAGLLLALGACGSDAKTSDTTAAIQTTIVAPTTAAAQTTAAPQTTGTPSAASTPPGDTAAATTGSAASGEAPSKDVKVAIGDFKYMPAMTKVAAGGTVTFTNNDDTLHTATLTGMFDTGPLAKGESKAITFDKPGTYKYTCSFHPFMSGTIVVV